MPKICPRYAQDMPNICPRCARVMPEVCAKYTQDTLKMLVMSHQNCQIFVKSQKHQLMPDSPTRI